MRKPAKSKGCVSLKENHMMPDESGKENNAKSRKKMNYEIYRVAFFRATVLSKYFLIIILIIFYTYCSIKQSTVVSIAYIILLSLFIPFTLEMLFGEKPKSEEPVVFPALRKKYHYIADHKKINNTTMLLLYLILMLWQRNFLPKQNLLHVTYFPTIALALSLAFRIIGTAWYYFYIKNKLSSGRFR